MKLMKLQAKGDGHSRPGKEIEYLTVGLESELTVAVGARIMLQCSLSTQKGF